MSNQTKSSAKKKVTLYLPVDLIKSIKYANIENGHNISTFVEQACQKELKNNKKNKK